MSCGITAGIGIDCDDLRRVGGVRKDAYMFNIEGVIYTYDADGNITAIMLPDYNGLFKMESRKGSHSGGYTFVDQSPGGNKFYQHDVILKLFPDDPIDDQIIEEIAVADVGTILEDNNQRFFLYGTNNGLEQTAGTQNTGQETGSDISDTITLTGAEPDKPKRINLGSYQATKDYLESLVQ